MTEETKLRNKTKLFLQTLSSVHVDKISDRYTSGIPDFIGCCNGRYFALELKAKKGVVDPLQKYVMNDIKRTGGEAVVCRSIDDVMIFMTVLISKGGV